MVWELTGDYEKLWLFAENMTLKPVKRQMRKESGRAAECL